MKNLIARVQRVFQTGSLLHFSDHHARLAHSFLMKATEFDHLQARYHALGDMYALRRARGNALARLAERQDARIHELELVRNKLFGALTQIHETTSGLAAPNGSMRKVHRIASGAVTQ